MKNTRNCPSGYMISKLLYLLTPVQTPQAICIRDIALYFDHPSPIDKHDDNLSLCNLAIADEPILLNHYVPPANFCYK